MRKITKIKRMLMTEKGTSVVEIQRRLSVGYKEAKSILQKLEVKSANHNGWYFFCVLQRSQKLAHSGTI